MESGVIAINKPQAISSAKALAFVKKKIEAKKAGHTGTLDPFATGLLLCTINQGTKISRFFLSGKKRYLARIHLGIQTNTYDPTGKVTYIAKKNSVFALDKENITKKVNSFHGIQNQVPPSFSALKYKGQPLYKLARKKKEILKPARQIEIFDIKLLNIDLPFLDIDILCSQGTYIRSIAFDLGINLKCGAHLAKLCRTKVGSFKLEDAISLEDFEKLDSKDAKKRIVSLSDSLGFMQKLIADKNTVQKIKFGQTLTLNEFETKQFDQSLSHCFKIVDEKNKVLSIVQLDKNAKKFNYCCVFNA